MITHCEATLTMCRIIEIGKSFLRREGYLFPAVYALTKDKPLGPESERMLTSKSNFPTECLSYFLQRRPGLLQQLLIPPPLLYLLQNIL